MKQILIILVTAMLAVSCTKENITARRTGNVDELTGVYSGKMYYTNYLSIDTTLGLPDQTGVDSGFYLVITRTDYAGHELKLTYTDGTDSTSIYADEVTDDEGQIYFNIPLQLNEENAEMRGNQCMSSTLGTFDAIYVKSTGALNFCTHYQISTPNSNDVYGESNEVYVKQ